MAIHSDGGPAAEGSGTAFVRATSMAIAMPPIADEGGA